MVLNQGLYDLFRPDLEHPTREDFDAAAPHDQRAAGALGAARGHQQRRLFLASEEARYVTGVTLPVDAGATTK